MVRRNSVGELGFFDLEAEESRDSDSNSSGSDSESDDASSSSSGTSFSCFMQFPPELRARVWEMFCSDLEAKARVLRFMVMPNSEFAGNLVVSPNVIDQTRPLRRLMAVHRESRRLAKVVYPHTLHFKADYDGKEDASMVFNQYSDIIALVSPFVRMEFSIPALQTEPIRNLAFPMLRVDEPPGPSSMTTRILRLFRNFPNLKRLFHQIDDWDIRTRRIRWVVSERTHQVLVETFEEKPGVGENTQTVYCWPDIDVFPDFAMPEDLDPFLTKDVSRLTQDRGIKLLPMVTFTFEDSVGRYRHLLKNRDEPHLESDGHHNGEDSSADDDSDESTGTDLDEYESEGIDDSDLDDDDEEEDNTGAIPVQGENLEDSDQDSLLQAARDPSEARFSSPELDEEQSVKQTERGSFKRKIVIDSDDDDDCGDDDDDDDDDHETRVKRPRLARRIVSDSDDDGDEDDDEAVNGGSSSRRRAASCKSESSGTSDDEPVHGATSSRRRTGPADVESSSSSEDNEDDESVRGGPTSRLRAAPSDVEPSDGRSEQQTSDTSSDDGDSVEEEDPQDDDEGDGSDGDDLIDGAISEDSAGSSHEEDE
ncbi:hypothetical protein CDD80_3602 [Ophiocordyceps camponoti-rufipedis]|uniref:2EXR domain-containing protein n=1 Tax=Ophiocordyceps camponoti-rufipedis TaxID=2004952 RepID=A0A2C5XW24_9HYPO|nr:hypothetical protein CDD80_3602 [Ophiocordyceps camponoti-rufipedis]